MIDKARKEHVELGRGFEQIILMMVGIPCQLLFIFMLDVEIQPPHPVKGLFLVLTMLLTEHVNTPGEYIQML